MGLNMLHRYQIDLRVKEENTEKTIKKVGKELVDAVGNASDLMKNSEFDKEVYDQSGLRTCMEIIRNNNNTSSTITISWNRILWK